MLEQAPNIRGVLAANDGIGDAVIKVLRKHKLNGTVPVTGQDATLEGLQNLLTGDQCMTVYKATKLEAVNAANLAVKLFKGEQPQVADTLKDPESGGYVPFVSLSPLAITLKNINKVVAEDKYIPEAQLCKGKYLELCRQHQVGSFVKADKDDEDS
jgi:D-xylose transport system substrate-binding protein